MAWVAAVPAIASFIENMMSKSGDDAQREAGAAKIRAMQAGANQLAVYRPELEQQMLGAMNNQMAAYGPAQNVLSKMYGGHGNPGPPPGTMGPHVGGRTMSGAPPPQGAPMSFPVGGNLPQGMGMGFGGEAGLPPPSQLRRKV